MKGCHILIVGGGLGGLTAAAALQHFGVKVTVAEQALELKEIGAGVIITPQAMHTLNFLGIGERVAREAGEGSRHYIRNYATGEILRTGPTSDELTAQFGATFHQGHRADLHQALVDKVLENDPDSIRLGHVFDRLVQNETSVTAFFTNGESLTADALIGCDGNNSRVRAEVFGSGPAEYVEQVAFRALMPIEDVPEEIRERNYGLFIGPKRLFLHYPLRNETVMNVIAIAHEPRWQAEGWAIPATIKEFRDLYGDFHPSVLAMIEKVTPELLFKWGLRDREPLDQWTKGRVTMLGDAAHPMTPFLGQGACIAMEDGMVLARAVDKASSIDEAFAIYEGVRKERANGVQLASREQGRELQGRVSKGANPGQHAQDRGLFNYNPVTVPI